MPAFITLLLFRPANISVTELSIWLIGIGLVIFLMRNA
jgi:hypothetical protein